MTGGCQCSRIRYEVDAENDEAYLCHCRMCQRATGGVSIAFKNVPKASVRWTTQEPDYYASSPIARRGFCSACGTPLTFEYPDSDNMDLTVGSLDDPSGLKPKHNFGAEGLHEHWLNAADLPRYKAADYEPLKKRWEEKVGKVPD
ncbi:GFA family protein [Parasphingopyxis marina]|uniref:GFA family protein n=1 Tax=Parasphingopyxis marina TaxID=2761622 RepID=A0A842HX73_9SPHN|nr:GFA family protein [Parasphingopyxis marina]MBC2777706.1 GFA family protein [Parasphingopyxis marina]